MQLIIRLMQTTNKFNIKLIKYDNFHWKKLSINTNKI